MSYRISRAIGYGMLPETFDKYSLVPSDEMWDVLQESSAKNFIVPKDRRLDFLSKNILNEDFYSKKKVSPNDLYQSIHTPDECLAHLFFPNGYFSKIWHHYDDDLDYAFESRRDDPIKVSDPRDFLIWPRFGFYPFANNLMLADGTHVAWDYFTVVEKHPEWLPAVPPSLRFWTKKLGIFDDNGVNQLRPLIAQWWS